MVDKTIARLLSHSLRTRNLKFFRFPTRFGGLTNHILKGLILAQNERWRRGLGMQVERIPAL
jgi:hypothetical protein